MSTVKTRVLSTLTFVLGVILTGVAWTQEAVAHTSQGAYGFRPGEWRIHSTTTDVFGELKRTIPGISSRMLTERLRGLETAQIVFRDYRPTIPPEVRYGLTERGQELGTVLASLNLLAQRWFLEKNYRITNNALFYSADSRARLNLYRASHGALRFRSRRFRVSRHAPQCRA